MIEKIINSICNSSQRQKKGLTQNDKQRLKNQIFGLRAENNTFYQILRAVMSHFR